MLGNGRRSTLLADEMSDLITDITQFGESSLPSACDSLFMALKVNLLLFLEGKYLFRFSAIGRNNITS